MVHQYKLNGYNIVLDTCSGAIHVVDEVAYDIIAMIREKDADQITHEIMARYGHCMMMHGRIPEALSGAMANQMYVANFDREEDMMAHYADLAATY